MSNEEFIKLIDDEITECNELWDVYYEKGDEVNRKRVTDKRIAFEMFKRKVLKKMGGSVN